jgi:hypothetical protein
MMGARLAAHSQISMEFRRGTERWAAYDIAVDLVALAAAGHTGLMEAVESVYSVYCQHVGMRNGSRVKATRLWTDAVTAAIAETGRALPPRDPCADRPRLTVVHR